MISPLAAAAARRALARSGQGLREQSIDPAKEIFTVYVPATKPPHGYGLLVFVPPWGEAKLPQDWSTVLDQYGVIYVSAANSANDANVLGRRDPLALIAYQNIVDRYPVDPEHVFIGGFSGGSRVAMRLALGYPDVFRGALLDAGADPIGDAKAPLPPRDLMLQFQSTSRLVYISGDEDTLNLQTDKGSMRSMRDWCVTATDDEVAPHTSHHTPDGIALARVFAALYAPVPPDPSELASCRAGIDAEVTSKLQQVDALIASGNRDDARNRYALRRPRRAEECRAGCAAQLRFGRLPQLTPRSNDSRQGAGFYVAFIRVRRARAPRQSSRWYSSCAWSQRLRIAGPACRDIR